jgi:hypothetical protein
VDARSAKAERGKAMDAIVDLLLERAVLRQLLTECLGNLAQTPAADQIERRIRAELDQ